MDSATTYYSKKDLWLGLVIWVPMLTTLVLSLVYQNWAAIPFTVLLNVLIASLWFGTRYIVTEDRLIIMLGAITYANIPLTEITCVEKTDTWLSAPACSLDRWQVNYGRNGSVVISPKDGEGFGKLLTLQADRGFRM